MRIGNPWVGVALALAALGLVPARPAHACGNSMAVVVPDAAKILRAQQRLLVGDAAAAFELAHQGVHHVEYHGIGEGPWIEDPEAARAEAHRQELLMGEGRRTMASAVVRLGGRVNLRKGRALKEVPPRRAQKNLLWAQQVLVAAFDDDKSPVNQARMAEALASSDDHWLESLTQLRGLAKDDLMPDAFGWAALAKLEARAAGAGVGSDAARMEALRMCHVRAADNARRICGRLPRGRS